MNAAAEIRHTVVVPVYKSRGTLVELIERLSSLSQRFDDDLEVVFVIDGSPDDSEAILRRSLPARGFDAQILTLSRNFGSFSAIRAGLKVARGGAIAVMAADLQEPAHIVEDFFDLLDGGQVDVVFGQRLSRADPALSSATASTYWSLYRRFINRDVPPGGVDVFGCTSDIARRITEFPEHHTSLVGLLFWVGYRRAFVPYERQVRTSGASGWSLSKKIRYFLDSVYSFTDLPILLLQAVGMIGFIGSTVVGLLILVVWALGGITQPGYTPLMITLLVSSSAILLGLGVVGSYVWRGYENSKSRPHELVSSHEIYIATERHADGASPVVRRVS